MQFLSIVSMLKSFEIFDTPHPNMPPLYVGSWLSSDGQWTYYTFQPLLVGLVMVGLFLGSNWSRWLLLVNMLASSIVAIPVRDARGIPFFIMSLLVGTIIFGMLFLAPTARAYFARPRCTGPLGSWRRLVSAGTHFFCCWLADRVLMDRFTNKISVATAVIALAVFALPALILGMVARWNVVIACRDGATVLIAISLFFAIFFLGSVASLHFTGPELLPRLDSKFTPIIIAIIGLLGLALLRVSAYQMKRV